MILNKVQLITYVDRFGNRDISVLHDILTTELQGIFGGIHLLPFYYPIDGIDAGFDVIDHEMIDAKLGEWNHLQEFSNDIPVMADFIVNHISAKSKQFLDYLEKGEQSIYADLFLSFESVYGVENKMNGLDKIYRPRPGLPFTKFNLNSGKEVNIWTTFTSDQVDIDVHSSSGINYIDKVLDQFYKNGIYMIRLDAVGYAIKKPGTSCFLIEETYQFIAELTEKANQKGIQVLAEAHAHYLKQIEISKVTNYVYDFALPVLVFDILFFRTFINFKNWLNIRPKNSVTVLDTHDGIGIIDLAVEDNNIGLIESEKLEIIVDRIHSNSNQESKRATGTAASNVDLYQVNCTYYDALGKNNYHYLLARAIQLFVPGIPQIYYMGFLCGENDMELLADTQVGRDINRSYFSRTEIQEALQKPVVIKLIELIKLRNKHPSFNGRFYLKETDNHILEMGWKKKNEEAIFILNLKDLSHSIMFSKNGKLEPFSLFIGDDII